MRGRRSVLAGAGGAGGGLKFSVYGAVGVRRPGKEARLSYPVGRFSEMRPTPPEEE